MIMIKDAYFILFSLSLSLSFTSVMLFYNVSYSLTYIVNFSLLFLSTNHERSFSRPFHILEDLFFLFPSSIDFPSLSACFPPFFYSYSDLLFSVPYHFYVTQFTSKNHTHIDKFPSHVFLRFCPVQ